MNFESKSHASIPLLLICYAVSNGKRQNIWRLWRKVHLILELVHLLGGSWQLDKNEVKFEQRALKFQTSDITDRLSTAIIISSLVDLSV